MTPNETVEAAAETTPAEQTELTHDHSHEGHDHSHEGHVHRPPFNPELTRSVSVEASAEEVSKAYSKVIKRYSKLARIPGFRPGKVPEATIRNRFAKDIRQEVLESLVQERFVAEIKAQGLNPISEPQLSELFCEDGQPLRFRAQFETAPTVDVAGYDTVTVEKPNVALEEAEYEAEMDRVLDSHATIEPVEEDRPLADGDWAEISFTGARRKAEGDTSEHEADEIDGQDVMVEIGGKNTLPAFNDALRGQSKGSEFELEVSYPSDFGDVRLAGITVDYKVTVNGIKRKVYPEKNDEFAKQLGEYETWADFEAGLRENATAGKKQQAENEAKGKLVDALVEKFQFPVPESFVNQQIDVRLDRGLRALAQQGMTREQMQTLDFPRLREAQRDEAVKEVKASLILDKIAAEMNVEVKEDDIERELMIMSLQTREPLETLRTRMNNDGTVGRMREQMRREATATALYEKLA
ncbi:trigger factor [Terriglobus roseus]|uniref:trigger factor n=1 Tax=Terriglobus roseus TaxID=392734 RepID=UPI000945D31D|nr:trigger factor [Terriglobus roseus]